MVEDTHPAVEDDHPLTCVECGRVSDSAAAGWRGYYDTQDELVLFCRDCAERVFGITT